jgi:3-oxoacyl-(acyl-carrier-protein) synthase
MSSIFIHGIGAVSPAGWGVSAFREALLRGEPLPAKELTRPGWTRPLRVRQVPAPTPRLAFMAHTRLRRTSPIAHYAVGTALEALGEDAVKYSGGSRLGIISCAMSGCVNYSRRFYDEVLKEPATASPLVFPETVFNAPASHLAALLGATAISYTLVGDPGIFLNGLALAADWLLSERVDGCLVIGAEEMDWLAADAMRLFDKNTMVSDGAGAVYLRREANRSRPGVRTHMGSTPSPRPDGERARVTETELETKSLLSPDLSSLGGAEGEETAAQTRTPAIQLRAITSPQLFTKNQTRALAARRARAEIPAAGQNVLLCDGLLGIARADRDEQSAWRDWTGARLSPKKILGEGLMAAAAWQCVAALDALAQNQYTAANVSVVGCNEQAIAVQFVRVV